MLLVARGCERILLVPLYPQYCAATTATVCDEAFRVLMTMRRQPTLRVVPPYHDDPVYIEALASSTLETELTRLPFKPEAMIASFHGIPKDYLDQGRSLLPALLEDHAAAARRGSSATTRS